MKNSFKLECSLNKSRWVLPDADFDEIEKISRRYQLPEVVARMLIARGIEADKIESFLNPTLKNDFPDPFSLKGMEEMALDMAEAIATPKKFAIFGDFDVDGATSSALLYRFLKACEIEARVCIPDRLTEGYGPNIEALQMLKDEGAEILFMLDCGTTAFDTIKAGADLGLEIVIIDHHEAEECLPAASHVINPKRRDDESGLDVLAAVGVTFMACVAINNKLREMGFFQKAKMPEPQLKNDLDLVALGTVCDMVPLTGINRLLVRQGLVRIQNTENIGLKALIDVSGVTSAIDTYHFGFILGPRINAGSRVHRSDLGASLLRIEDVDEARNIAWTLNDCNDKRKAIQIDMERLAISQAESMDQEDSAVIIVDLGKDGHQGLSGLVAGRLKDKYGRPACVISEYISENGDREGRGSARSIPGIHIAQALIDARNAGLLEKGGGHAMAGGFTILPDKLEEFKAFINDHVRGQMESTDTSVETVLDGILSVRGARPDFVKLIHNHVGPFGQEYPEPLFLFQNVRIHSVDIVGEAHLRCMISDWEGASRIKAMAFRAVGTELGDALLKRSKQAFHIAAYVKHDNWQGRDQAELHIKDAVLQE